MMKVAIIFAIVGIGLLANEAQAQEADPKPDGQTLFNNHCRTCHTTRPGDNRLGPNLAGLIGRTAGSLPDYYAYSTSMKNAGFAWDEERLNKFIEDPDSVVANNLMAPYSGVANEEDRKAIVAFLGTVPAK